jgi:hypothetical protein
MASKTRRVVLMTVVLTLATTLLYAEEKPQIEEPSSVASSLECTEPTQSTDLPGIAPTPVLLACSASATCNNGSTITCNFTGSGGSCTYANANCSVGQQGYVKCGTNPTIYCPACPVVCEPPFNQSCSTNLQCRTFCQSLGFGQYWCAGGCCECEL